MCGISGFFHPQRDFTKEKDRYQAILDSMNQAQRRRGPDHQGTFLASHGGLAQVRLEIVEFEKGAEEAARRKAKAA